MGGRGWQDGVNGDAVEIKSEAKGPEEEGVSFYQLPWSLLCPFQSRVVSLSIN